MSLTKISSQINNLKLMINSYQFGQIEIDGKKYFKDLILLYDGRILPWQRKESHFLIEDDLKDLFLEDIEVLIIGSGDYGVMHVSEDLISNFKKRGIKVFVLKTEKATQKFNKFLEQKKKVAGTFHLTC